MKIAFWNCSATGNLGDDLCFLGTVEFYKQRLKYDFEIMNIFLLNEYTIHAVNECDLLVIGGGQLLERSNVLEKLGKHTVKPPIEFFGVGVGDMSDLDHHQETLCKVSAFYLRDEESFKLISSRNLKTKVFRDLDPSFFLKYPSKRVENPRPFGLALKNVNKSSTFKKGLAQELDEIGLPFVFYCFNSTARIEVEIDREKTFISDCDDSALANDIMKLMNRKELCQIRAYRGEERADEWVSHLHSVEFMICERYHSMVLCHQLGIPYRAIPYQRKISRFLEDNYVEERAVIFNSTAIGKAIKESVYHESSTGNRRD